MKFSELNEGRKKSLFNIEGIDIRTIKTKKPKFKGRGRTWDFSYKNINGEKTKVWLDTSYGWYGYFQKKLQWYKFKLDDAEHVEKWS